MAWYLEVPEGPKIGRGGGTTNRLPISASVLFFIYLQNLGDMALLAPILPAPLVFLLAFLSDVVMHHSCSMYYKDLL